jgi:hypothetical protein
LIPLPQVKLLDERFKADLDAIQLQSTQLEHLPTLLDHDKTTHISDQYSGALPVTTEDGTPHAEIPVILGVDAMTIEPYSEKSSRLLLLKETGFDAYPETLRQLEESAGISSYFFVHYMMPLDLILSKLVVSVITHTNGQANERSNTHLKDLKVICREGRFMTIAFSADGDNAYEEFLRPLCEAILSDAGQRKSLLELTAEVSKMDRPFVTDFLHFLKCLRNRLARHPLPLQCHLPPITADNLAELLLVGDTLKPKTKGAQLKDAIALQVFTRENLVTLLTHGKIQGALYFLPVVLWRVANQALNVTREV